MAEEAKPAPKSKAPKTMLVVATRQGFYVTRRFRPGQRFLLKERTGFRRPNGDGPKVPITITVAEQFSPRWMVRASDYKVEVEEEKIHDPVAASEETPSGDQAVIG